MMTYSADARRRALAAERDRRRNERRRAGCIVVPVELPEDAIDALVDRGRIGEWSDRDRAVIGEAIARLVTEYVAATTRGNAE